MEGTSAIPLQLQTSMIGVHKRCTHGREQIYCKECGGSQVCPHGRRRSFCKECVGGAICKHLRRRQQCSICSPENVYKLYKTTAVKRNYAFTITFQEFKDIVSSPCFYCGEKDDPRGIDRQDNTVGYVLGNSRPCCKVCNRMKSSRTESDFVKACCRISAHVVLQGLIHVVEE